MKHWIIRRVALGFFGVSLLAAPYIGTAQDPDRVYTAAELTSPVRVKSPQAAASAVERAYPPGMRAVGGRVQLQFVVQPNGRVDANSIEILVATTNQLGEAARRAVQQIEFEPGQVDGRAVRTLVQFPVTFAAAR